MKTIDLSTGEKVHLIDRLNWGQREEIKLAMASGMGAQISTSGANDLKIDGAAILSAKHKALEVCITEIEKADGSKAPYTREWMNALSPEDGDLVMDAVEEVTSPSKK